MAEIVTPLPSAAGGPQFRPPEALTAAHDVSGFSCIREILNVWLKRRALANEGKGISRTYVVAHGKRVVAYYTLAAGSERREVLPKASRHDNPEQIPVVVLGRLAVDRNFERRGIGRDMLQEAITRTIAASDEIGIRALVVHALDDEAVKFYLKFGFILSPLGDRTLLLPMQTAMRALLDQ